MNDPITGILLLIGGIGTGVSIAYSIMLWNEKRRRRDMIKHLDSLNSGFKNFLNELGKEQEEKKLEVN